LTQDDKVFVAIGFFLADNVLCYIDTNHTPVIGGEQTDERLSKATVAWYTTDPSSDLETDVIRAMAKEGKLNGKVAVFGAAADQASLDNKIKPLLSQLKVNVVDTALDDAPITDPEAGYEQAQTINERFKSKGVQQVLVIGTAAAAAYLKGLSRTDYHPQLRFTQPNTLQGYINDASNDLSRLDASVTGGGYDSNNRFESLGGLTKECIAMQHAGGLNFLRQNQVPRGGVNQVASSGLACTQVYLLKDILEKAGKTLNDGTFKAAGDSLGRVDLPFTPTPWNFGPPPHADGDPKVYLSEWDVTKKQYDQQ
jgi:hypothetical protein